MTFQYPEQRGADALGIVAQVAEVFTDEGQLGFGGLNSFYSAYFFNGFGL